MKKLTPLSPKLNLGSGNQRKEGWLNIDIDPKWSPDMLVNVEEGIPLKDNSVEEVYIKHVLEHIEPRKLGFVMSEIFRVCKNGAKVTILCPYFSCSVTYKTADHISAISYYTFDHIEGFNVVRKRLFFFRNSFGYENKKLTKILRILNPLFSFLPNRLPLVYERFFCWVFPVEEVAFSLRVVKQKE